MSKQKSFFRSTIGLGAVLMAGLAIWYFQRKPTAPQAARPSPALTTARPRPQSASLAEAAAEPSPFASTSAPLAATIPSARAAASVPVVNSASTPAVASASPAAVAVRSDATVAPTRDEITATANMYAAHASLRIPEVADPDSKSNQQILNAMVSKALVRSAAQASPVRP